jgi:hypothetical protein
MNRLDTLALNDQGFVFDPATGNSFTLNPSGMLLFKGLRDGCDETALATRLVQTFAIAADRAREDVADFNRQLAKLGLG